MVFEYKLIKFVLLDTLIEKHEREPEAKSGVEKKEMLEYRIIQSL